jgi:hypothetical protein
VHWQRLLLARRPADVLASGRPSVTVRVEPAYFDPLALATHIRKGALLNQLAMLGRIIFSGTDFVRQTSQYHRPRTPREVTGKPEGQTRA